MKYQSFSRITKTYHGVTFHPGDIKDVNGYINDSHFVRIKDNVKKSKNERSTEESDERPVRRTPKQAKQNNQPKEDKKTESEPVVDKTTEEIKAPVEEKKVDSE